MISGHENERKKQAEHKSKAVNYGKNIIQVMFVQIIGLLWVSNNYYYKLNEKRNKLKQMWKKNIIQVNRFVHFKLVFCGSAIIIIVIIII